MVSNSLVHQGLLEKVVRNLFKDHKVLSNVRKEASIKNPITGKLLEVDLFIPSLSLCFEFQDSYHFVTNWASQLSLNDIQVKDSYKHESLKAQEQTIIVVPCWWEGTIESLQDTIAFYRPDLFHANQALIPLNASSTHFKDNVIPDVDGLMLASFPHPYLLTEPVSASNPWWVGEKYDGIRVCWNANRNELYGRYGVLLDIPQSFVKSFPDIFLDAEIWCGRESFTDSQRLLLAEAEYLDWVFARVLVFDEPSMESRKLPFEKRYELAGENISFTHPFLIQAFRILCKSNSIPTRLARDIIEKGGEGIVLRKHGSLYTSGRSHSLIKLKATRGDKEALVTDITQDGDIIVQLPDNSTLQLPFPDSDTSLEIRVGDVVSFNYEHHSRSDVPVNPVIYRIRKDVDWLDILREHAIDSQSDEAKQGVGATKPFGYWVNEKRKNMRSFMLQYAKDNNFDPMVASNWYSISSVQFMNSSQAQVVLSYYQGSLIRALIHLFPDVTFDESKFSLVPQRYWQVVSNRRKFFLNVARERKIDPLVAENWYTITDKMMLEFKGANSVIKYYGSSFSRALVHLFPEVQFDVSKFASKNRANWRDIKSRRAFFEMIAKDKGFDPLIPSNWYSLSYNTIASYPGAKTIRRIYKGFKSALLQLYPTIGIDRTKFLANTQPPKYWISKDNSKEFFEQLAREKGFDSSLPENWYSVTKASVVAKKGGISLLKHYGGVGKALLKLYPNIGLDKNRFNLPANYWSARENRRKLFLTYAEQEGFDPLVPDNWYNLNKKTVLSLEGGNSMLARFSSSYIRALLDSFPEIGLDENKFKGKRKTEIIA